MNDNQNFLGGIEFKNSNPSMVISQYFCNTLDSSGLATRDELSPIEKNIIEKRISRTILTGKEKWEYDSLTKTYYYFQPNKFCDNIGGTYDKMLCTHFRWINYNENIKYGEFQGHPDDNRIMFNYDYGEKGVGNFKDWLSKQLSSGKPVKVYYIMQYPFIKKIPPQYNPSPRFIPHSITIESSGNVKPIISQKYRKKI